MDWKRLFLSAEGRVGRRDFWIGFAIIFVASIVLGAIPVIGQIIGLLLIWPQVCVHAKRLHDMGRTAWLILIPFVVTIAAMGFVAVTGGLALMGAAGEDYETAAGAGAASGLAILVAFLVGVGFLLWVGLSPGQAGPNRFGEEPARGPGTTGVQA